MPFIKYTLALLFIAFTLLYSFTASSINYSYDELGRLTSVQYDDGKRIEYIYDAAGNRTTLNVDAGSGTSGGNNPPIAVNDFKSGQVWQQLTIYPLANDSDPDGDALTISKLVEPSCSISSNSTQITCFFLASGNFDVEYTVSDGKGGSGTGFINIHILASDSPFDPIDL